ncbi:MAG: invasin domain 3-containing protein [Gemmatimonadota bacterium]
MRFPARLAAPCAALLLTLALAPRPLAAQSGDIGVRGDVNRDGGVTAVDALAVLSHVVGKPLPATYTVQQDGDADGNGQVTALDALVILGHAVGRDVARYPVGRRLLSGVVGSAGGSVVSRGDSIRLDFPEGALAEAVDITVQPADGMAADGGKLPGAMLELGPSGQRFARPVRLTLRYDPAAVPQGVPAAELRIHRREGDVWTEVPGGGVDVATGTVTAELSGFSTYAVMPRAAPARGLALSKEAGDAQTGVAGRPPADFLVARLVNAAGRGVPGVELAWEVTEGGGSVRALEARTDSAGRVRAVFTLGAVPGTNAVRVSAAGAEPAVFTARGVADAPAAATVVAGADQAATAGTAVATPPAVRVTDSSGNAVVDVAVTFAVASGGGSITGGAARTDGSGVATVGSWTLGTTAGPNTLAATVQGGPTATIAATGLPGAAAAISIRSGDGGTAVVATPRALEARVVDAHGNGVPGVTVAWAVATGGGSLAAPASATDAAGVASAAWTLGGTVGTQTVTASAAGLAGSPLTFTVATTPAAASQLALAAQPSPTARSGIALAAQPVAQLRDAFGNAVAQAGVAVTAAIASGGGTLGGTATVSTDAAGVATFTDLAISGTVGQRTLAFSADGLTGVTSDATDVAAGTPAGIAVAAGDGQTATAGSAVAVAPSVRVTDASGNPVSGVGVAFAVASGGGSVAGATVSTDASGVAAVGSWTLGTTAGANTLTASSTGLADVTFAATGVAGAAAAISVQSGDGGSAQVGTARTLEARVVDANGNPVQGTTVSWAVAAGGGSLGAPSSTTDAAGVASATWTFGTTAGAQGATASAAGLAGSPLAFAATATPAPASRLAVAAQPSSGARSGIDFAAQPAVQLQDAHGNAVAQSGVAVTAAIATGAGTLGGTPTAATDAAGRATFAGLSISGATGAYTLGFSAAGLADAASGAITLAPGDPAALTVATQPSPTAQSGIAFPTQPTVQLRDASGNAVSQAGVAVTAAIASGGGTLGGTATATTDAMGLATFGNLAISGTAGQRTLSFASAGLAGASSAAVDVVAGAPASLTVSTQPSSSAQSGIALPAQPVLQLRDADGNAVPQAGVPVTASIASGTGTLGGTATVATDAAGRAAFTDLAVSGPVGSYTLGFASSGLAGATSGTITLAAGAPATLAVNAGSGQTAAAGTAVATAPSVVVRDGSNNPVAGVSVSFAVATGGGSVAGGTATTDASGIATVGSWTLGTTAGSNTLTASAGGLTPVTFTATATAGAATQLVLTAQPSATAQSGIAFGAQPSLQLRDAYGNDAAQAGVSVTAAIASGGGTLGGTGTVSTDAAGRASFAGLSISGTVGDRTLSFSAGGVTGATSSTISVTAGAASQLVITRQPSSTVQNGSFLGMAPILRLRDASGNDVAQAGVSVTVAIASGGPVLSGTTVQSTDAAGQVVFGGLVITGAAGDRTLGFSAAGLAGATSSAITVTPGPAASLAVSAGDGQTATAGSAVATAPSVLVRDVSNNPVPGVSVTFAVASGGGSVTGGTATTDAGGIVTVGSWTLGTAAGANTLTASSGGLTPATFTATGVAGPAAAISIQSGDGGTATVASTRTLEARVVDANGNPVAGHTVSWAAATGGGSVSAPTSTTSAAGVASVGWTLGTAAGAQTATATSTDLTGSPLTFTATTTAAAAAAGSSTLAASPASITADGTSASTLTVQLRDPYGNAVGASAGTVVLSATSGTLSAVTDNGNGTYTATLTAPTTVGSATVGGTLDGGALAGTATVAFVPGAAARYTVTPSAATATAGSTVTVTAQLVDANGNAVPAAGRTVTWSSANGGSFATPTGTTDAAGTATVVFTTSTTSGTTHTVTADDGAVNGTSGSVVTQVGAASAIVKSGADGVSLAAGSAVAPLPTVRVVDANGNGVPGVSVVFAVTAGGGGVTGETQTTDAVGAATVGGWTLGTTAGANTLSATAGSLSAGFAVTGTVGPASAAGTQITTVNAALTAGSITTVTVQLKDQYGNDVTTGGATVALATDLGTVGPVTDVGNGTYTADLTHTGTDGTATVTGTLGGTPIADNAVVTFQSGGIQRTWTGLAGSSWNTAGSWSPRGTPTSSDTIVVNGGGTQPQVTDADKTVERLVMTSAGGTLDLGGFKLVVTGDAVVSGGAVSNGIVQMSGSGRSIQGTVPNLLVTGSVSAGGSTTASGKLTVTNGSLTISNQTLTIKGQ